MTEPAPPGPPDTDPNAPFLYTVNHDAVEFWPRPEAERYYANVHRTFLLVLLAIFGLLIAIGLAFDVITFLFIGFCLGLPVIALAIALWLFNLKTQAFRRIPLVVDGEGRVRYAGQELSAPNTVRRVLVWSGRGEAGTEYRVGLEILVPSDPGRIENVCFPGPYFESIDRRADAEWLAARVAGLLGVPLVFMG